MKKYFDIKTAVNIGVNVLGLFITILVLTISLTTFFNKMSGRMDLMAKDIDHLQEIKKDFKDFKDDFKIFQREFNKSNANLTTITTLVERYIEPKLNRDK